MQLLTQKLPIEHNLFLCSDFHFGSTLTHRKGIEKLVNDMCSSAYGLPESKNFGVFHGDAIDAIQCDDIRRYDPNITKSLPLEMADECIHEVRPIASKFVAWLEGTHERAVWRGGNLAAYIAKELRVPYGTFSCVITYIKRGGDVLYRHYATHGKKPINSVADDPNRRLTNMKLQLKRYMKFQFSCALNSRAHTHKILVLPPSTEFYLTDNREEIQTEYIKAEENVDYIHPDLRWYVSTGGFLKKYGPLGISSYVEYGEMDPLEMGYTVVIYRGRIEEIIKVIV